MSSPLRRPRRFALPAGILGALALTFVACTGPPSARGWAPPEPVPSDGQLLVVTTNKGTMFGLSADNAAAIANAGVDWQFPPNDLASLPISDQSRQRISEAIDGLSPLDEGTRSDLQAMLNNLHVSGNSVKALRQAIERQVPPSVEGRDQAAQLVEQLANSEHDAVDNINAFFGRVGVSNDQQRAFAGSFSGTLFALDLSDGTPVWVRDVGEDIVGGIDVDGDRLYFGTKGKHVYAVDTATGDPAWTFNADGEIWTTPTVANDTIYVPTLDGTMYALAPDGSVRWSFDQPSAGIATRPLVEDGAVVFGSFDETLYAVEADTGELRWSKDGNNWFWAAPAFADGVVFAATLDGTVYAVDVETGDDRWTEPFDASDAIRAGPAVSDGGLVVATVAGDVFNLDVQTGRVQSGPVDAGDDVLADLVPQDGVVFLSPRAPRLAVIDTSGGQLSLAAVLLPE